MCVLYLVFCSFFLFCCNRIIHKYANPLFFCNNRAVSTVKCQHYKGGKRILQISKQHHHHHHCIALHCVVYSVCYCSSYPMLCIHTSSSYNIPLLFIIKCFITTPLCYQSLLLHCHSCCCVFIQSIQRALH